MSAREFARWGVFENIDGPIGQRRDDILAALIRHTIHGAFSSSSTAPPLDDFMPKWDEREVDDGDDGS